MCTQNICQRANKVATEPQRDEKERKIKRVRSVDFCVLFPHNETQALKSFGKYFQNTIEKNIDL